MIRYALAALAALCLLSANVEARPRSTFDTQGRVQCDDRYPHTCDQRGWREGRAAKQSRRSFRAEQQTGRRLVSDLVRPAVSAGRFIRGRLVCAVNVGAALEARGVRGTGSALAKSYLGWGRPSGPVPGAVAVFSRGKRGGHVAIVHSVQPDGTVIYLNPSSRRQAWQVGPYSKRPIAYRVSG